MTSLASRFFLCLLVVGFISFQINAKHTSYARKDKLDLRIGIVHDPPRTVIHKDPMDDSIVTYTGFMKEMLDILLQNVANSTIPVEIPVNAQQNKSGVETPIINYIASGKIDLSSRLLPLGAYSANLVGTTYPILITQMCLVQPIPGPLQKYSILFYSFEPLVWLWFGIALVATTLALSILMKRKTGEALQISTDAPSLRQLSKKETRKKNVAEVANYILGTTVNRGRRLLTNRLLVQIVAGAWSLAAFVFVYSYRGVMIAKVYAPAQMALISTFEDVVQSDGRLLVGRNTPYANILLNASTGTLKAVGDILRRNPDDVILPIMDNVYRILLTERCTYLEDVSFADILVYRAMLEHQGSCKLTKGKPLKAQTPLGLFIAENSKFRSALDHRIMRLWESGLNQHIAKRAVSRRIEKCSGSSVSGRFLRAPQPLTLVTLSAAFVILAAGAGLSLVVYFLEVLMFRHKTRSTHPSSKKRKRSDTEHVLSSKAIQVRPSPVESASCIEELNINYSDSKCELSSISSSSLNSSTL